MLIVSLQASTYSSQLALAVMKFKHRIQLEDELRALQSVLTENMKNTGFAAYNHMQPFTFLTATVLPSPSLTISQFGSEATNSCVLFTFDKNKSGVIETSATEQFGYRLRSKAIEYRVKGKACEATGWHDITDTRSTLITKLHFTIKQASSWGTLLEVTIDAQDVTYSDIAQTRTFTIGLANVHG
jgi:prepilin peptidase dependent protein B